MMTEITNEANTTMRITEALRTPASTVRAPATSAARTGLRMRSHTTAGLATRYGAIGPKPMASNNAKAMGTAARSKKGRPTDT